MASPRRVPRAHTRPQPQPQPQPQPPLRSPADGSLLAFLRHDRAPSSLDEEEDDDDEEDEPDEEAPATRDARPRARVSTTETAPQSTPPTPSGTTTSASAKRSRYLRESDRRDIIRRIDAGEKQSALAKEFGVTRAAVCHINKNRLEILTRSARADVHAGARHPKRGLYSTSRSNFYVHETGAFAVVDGRGELPIVYEVRSLALALHLTTLRSVETSARQFRATADRAFRVLLEEALAAVPTRHVEVVAANGATCQGLAPLRPACAMFMSESGYPMFEAFRAIQPDSPTGFMTLDHDDHGHHLSNNSVRRRVALRKLCAPAELHNHNVLLLDATCASALEACVAIQSLLDFGAQESSIFFVTLVISAAAIAEICEAFPRVHIVAAAVDSEVTPAGEIRPGVGNFQERYFNTTTIRQSDLGSNVDL